MRTLLGLICVVFLAIDHCYAQEIDVYKEYLKEFNNTRGHIPNSPVLDENRKKVRNFMKTKFEAAGLEVQMQDFSSTDTNTGKAANGTNLIAILKGSAYGTAKDEVIILAAHIDTPLRDAGGVNNDGTGLVGLITIAEALKGKDPCRRNNTVIFAAFDRAETDEIGQNITQCKKSCGSQTFIQNKARYIKNGKIKLVIVMDCISNYEGGQNSQHLAYQLSRYFKYWYAATQFSDSRGDYLAITGRNNEKDYIDEIYKTYDATKVKLPKDEVYTGVKFQWNIDGIPTAQNKSNINSVFNNGDHMSFWDANINAVLLTDTCYERKPYRPNCKLDRNCDVLSKLNDNDYTFMLSAISTVTKVTKKYICGACAECDINADCDGNMCTCRKGFSGNGKNCTDIDECEKSLQSCSKVADCKNTVGSYVCACKTGYTGDGKQCSAIGSATILKVIPQVLVFGLAMVLSYFWF